MSISTQPEPVERNMLITSTTLFGFMILEYTWNIRFEIKVIWPRIRQSADIKIFMIVRYVGLIGQIFNIWFTNRMASGVPNHPITCRAWFGYMTAITQLISISAQLLLMLRVRNMYDNHNYVHGVFIILVGAQCVVMTICAWMVVPDIYYAPTCRVVGTHVGQFYLGTSTVVVHMCLLVMMLWRYFRGHWREHSYLKIMARDCTCLAIVVIGTYLAVALTPVRQSSQTAMNILFMVIICSPWFSICHLIIQKEKFRHQMDCELTIVDPDNLEPSVSSDVYPAEPSESNTVRTEVTVAIDRELGIETKDISDERLSDRVDDTFPSNCILRMEAGKA